MLPVAFVISQAGRRADGGVRSISLIVDRLSDAGDIRPLIVTNAETPQTEAWRTRGYEVHVRAVPAMAGPEAGTRRRVWRLGRLMGANRWFWSFLRSSGIKVVHCNDMPAVWMAAPAALAARLPIVTNIRDTLGVRGPRWRLLRMLSTRVVVLSEEMKAWIEGELAPAALWPGALFASVDRIYSVVDHEGLRPATDGRRAQLRVELGLPAAGAVMVVVAAVGPKKRQLDLINHVARNPDALGPEATLCFVGDFDPERDPYAAACQAAAERLGPRIRFAGFSSAPALWYQAADVTLVPSLEEGLARCMIESLACGTPVVSFDVCSAREFLGEAGGGVVVPQGDFAGMAEAAALLAKDSTRARALGSAGRVLVQERCDPVNVARAYRALYESL